MPERHHRKENPARAIVAQRLLAFYAELKTAVEADSEDFYKRVMRQAERLDPAPEWGASAGRSKLRTRPS